jgi:hypothetical protein
MSDLSDYLEAALLDHTFRNLPYTSPTTVYLALYLDDPTDADTGTEVAGGGYARQAITFSRTANTVSNDAAISYTAAGAAYGTITHVGVHDALAAGNLLFKAALTVPKVIDDGDTLTFAIGDIDFTLD